MNPDARYYLVFDELDLFDPGDNDYLDSIIGLILAGQNFFHWARVITNEDVTNSRVPYSNYLRAELIAKTSSLSRPSFVKEPSRANQHW